MMNLVIDNCAAGNLAAGRSWEAHGIRCARTTRLATTRCMCDSVGNIKGLCARGRASCVSAAVNSLSKMFIELHKRHAHQTCQV
jgi:hypothetical protein